MCKCQFPLCPSNSVRDGYCIGHAKIMGIPIAPKQPKPIAKISEKKEGIRIDTVHQAAVEANFISFRQIMTGICINCGGKTCKNNNKYWKFSAAHIFPKNIFKSIAAHPAVLIELCYFDNSCHTNYDNKTLEATEMKCWPVILERFRILYPLIAAEERKYIPDYFLQEIEVSEII